MSFRIGAFRAEMTPDIADAVLMGWGKSTHLAKAVATPLYARAVAIEGPEGNRLVMVCLDVCFITEALRAAVIERTGLAESELMISATHTHSAPGAISTYIVYALPSSGMVLEVLNAYADGAALAIKEAMRKMRKGTIRFASGEFPIDEPVAFNRAVRAYNRNPEVRRVSRKDRHLAVDREMTLLRFDAEDGTPIASWNWFSVHATSMHSDRNAIHGDNKGLAALELEARIASEGVTGYVAVFAQGAAGDVSPNFRYHRGLAEKRGAFRDDDASCHLNALLQCERAYSLLKQAKTTVPLEPRVQSAFEFHYFGDVAVAPDFVQGRHGVRTGPAELSCSMLRGTQEGHGVSGLVVRLLEISILLSRLIRFRWPFSQDPAQGNKITSMQTGTSRIFGYSQIEKMPLPAWIDPFVARVKKWAKEGVMRQRPHTPQVLPIQIARLGQLVIGAVPAEFTTISGRRLRKTLERAFWSEGAVRAIVQGYANAYSGYVVTPEEYPQQGYEAGCTHFGRWTLPAYLTVFRELSRKMISGESLSSLRPLPPSREYVSALTCRAPVRRLSEVAAAQVDLGTGSDQARAGN